MTGGDPAGPDNGYITAKEGEYVLNRGAVARYGQPLLDAINAGRSIRQMLQTAAAHSVGRSAGEERQGGAGRGQGDGGAARCRDTIATLIRSIDDQPPGAHADPATAGTVECRIGPQQ